MKLNNVDLVDRIKQMIKEEFDRRFFSGQTRHYYYNGRQYDAGQEIQTLKNKIQNKNYDYVTHDELEELQDEIQGDLEELQNTIEEDLNGRFENIETSISTLEAQIDAIGQSVITDIQPELLKLYHNLKTTNINLAKNELNDKINHEKDDPSKPISQLTDLVVDPLLDNAGMDSLNSLCYYDNSSKTIRSMTAVYRRPIYKKPYPPDLGYFNINGGTIFYDAVNLSPTLSIINVYCLTKMYDLIYIPITNGDFGGVDQITTTNKEILPEDHDGILGGYRKSEDAFYFIVRTFNPFDQFKLFKLNLAYNEFEEIQNKFEEIQNINGAIPPTSNAVLAWYDNTNDKLIIKMNPGFGGNFYIYDPDTNTMTQSTQFFPPAGLYYTGAYDAISNKYIHIQADLMKLYTFQFSNTLNDIVVDEKPITSPLPQVYGSYFFVKEDYMFILYPPNTPFTMYKINLNTGSVAVADEFIFPPNTTVKPYVYSAFGYVQMVSNGSYYGAAIIINPYNTRTLGYIDDIHIWEFKHPNAPGAHTNWYYVSKAISTSYIPKYAYALVQGLTNSNGQLTGISFSIDDGATWTTISDPDDLVDLTSLTGGQQFKIKIHAYGDYEITAYAFGCME